jgi:Tfp pilus assembly protein PilV
MSTAGSSLVEVLVALVLTGLAAGALAAITAVSGRALVTARRDATATALAGGRLDMLRAGPLADGSDAIARDGVGFARRWTASSGRGRPSAFAVTVDWERHAFALRTEALP